MRPPALGRRSLQDASVAIMAATTPTNIRLCTLRPATRPPGIPAANPLPALIVASIWSVLSFVLAVVIRIELRTIAGVIDDLLCRRRRCRHCRQESGCSQQCELRHGYSPLI